MLTWLPGVPLQTLPVIAISIKYFHRISHNAKLKSFVISETLGKEWQDMLHTFKADAGADWNLSSIFR